MIHSLEWDTPFTYIYRVYEKPFDNEYKFSMPVSFRENGLFECYAWNSIIKLWPEVGITLYPVAIEWIEMRLQEIEPKFRYIMGTFLFDRLKLFKRLFRGAYSLKVIDNVRKRYNGKDWDFAIVGFRHYLFGNKKKFRDMWE